MEYLEEHPALLARPAMGARLLTYYQRRDDQVGWGGGLGWGGALKGMGEVARAPTKPNQDKLAEHRQRRQSQAIMGGWWQRWLGEEGERGSGGVGGGRAAAQSPAMIGDEVHHTPS